MAIAPTPKFKLSPMEPAGSSESLKDLNHAISMFDSAMYLAIIDRNQTSKPSTGIADGDAYHVDAGGWPGNGGEIGIFNLGLGTDTAPGDSGWVYIPPFGGLFVWNLANNYRMTYTDTPAQWEGGVLYSDLGGGDPVATVVTRVNNLLTELEHHGVLKK